MADRSKDRYCVDAYHKKGVLQIHLCYKDGEVIRGGVRVNVWTEWDKNLSDYVVIDPHNSEIYELPIRLLDNEEFIDDITTVKTVDEAIGLLIEYGIE